MNRRTFLASVLGVAAAPVAVTAVGEAIFNLPPEMDLSKYKTAPLVWHYSTSPAFQFGSTPWRGVAVDGDIILHIGARMREDINQMNNMLFEELYGAGMRRYYKEDGKWVRYGGKLAGPSGRLPA